MNKVEKNQGEKRNFANDKNVKLAQSEHKASDFYDIS